MYFTLFELSAVEEKEVWVDEEEEVTEEEEVAAAGIWEEEMAVDVWEEEEEAATMDLGLG